MKTYYQEHKDEIVKYQRKYFQEHKDERVKYQRKYRQGHKDERRKYYQDHKNEIAEYKAERRKNRPYKKQGDFLVKRLKELNKNQSWLARELGVTRELVSLYSRGIYPVKRKELRERLCEILRIKYSDLEKLVENQNGRS